MIEKTRAAAVVAQISNLLSRREDLHPCSQLRRWAGGLVSFHVAVHEKII